jgi:hypothetical protein
MSTSRSSDTPSRRTELTRKSVVILFAVGAILLAAPLGTVLTEYSICRSDSSACIHSEDYRYLVSAFPYIMLAGGILIAYNMKRISDSINRPLDEGEEGTDDESLTSYS